MRASVGKPYAAERECSTAIDVTLTLHRLAETSRAWLSDVAVRPGASMRCACVTDSADPKAIAARYARPVCGLVWCSMGNPHR